MESIEPPEAEAAAFPAVDRLRLVLLGLLGYGVLAGVLVLVVVVLAVLGLALANLHAGWLVFKIAWLPLVVAGVVLRALWVSIPEPQGWSSTPSGSPPCSTRWTRSASG